MSTPHEPEVPQESAPSTRQEEGVPLPIEQVVGDGADSASDQAHNLLAMSPEKQVIQSINAELARNPEPGKEDVWEPINLEKIIKSMIAVRNGVAVMTDEIETELRILKDAILAKEFVGKKGVGIETIETNEQMREFVGVFLDAIPHLDPAFKGGARIEAAARMAKTVWEGYPIPIWHIPIDGATPFSAMANQAAKFREDAGRNAGISKNRLNEFANTIDELVREFRKSPQERREVKKESSANEQSNTLPNFEKTPSAQEALEFSRKELQRASKTAKDLMEQTGEFDGKSFDAMRSRIEDDFIAAIKKIVQEIIPNDYDYMDADAPQNKGPDAQIDEINVIMKAFGSKWH